MFTAARMDIVERVHLSVELLFVAAQRVTASGSFTMGLDAKLLKDTAMVLGSEVFVDVFKHAFISKVRIYFPITTFHLPDCPVWSTGPTLSNPRYTHGLTRLTLFFHNQSSTACARGCTEVFFDSCAGNTSGYRNRTNSTEWWGSFQSHPRRCC